MPRFFIDKNDITDNMAVIRDTAHLKALRIRSGDTVVLCDGEGMDYVCRLKTTDRGGAYAEIESYLPCENEPEIELRIFLAYAKGERLEYTVQKCTELGAKSFVLFPSARTVAVPDKKSLPGKLARLGNIAKSAAEQSGRGIIPEITAVQSFAEAVSDASRSGLALFPYEEETNYDLRTVLRECTEYTSVSVMTGAEGGFTAEEAAFARETGMRTVSLGRLILRCDTAPIAVAAAVMLC